jgi:hypothetical protein
VSGPPITISCECGEVQRVPYGETWACETCGRRWNTRQIPEDEYRSIYVDARRARVVLIGVTFGLAAVFGLLGAFVSEGLFLFMPLILGFWLLWYMPMWRRKQRLRARELPKWELHPE